MKNIICSIVCLFCLYTVFAQPGTLDISFGDSGRVINEAFIADCDVIALQQDGKIVTGGYYYDVPQRKSASVFARFNSDGSIDESFGDGGRVLVYGGDSAMASQVQSLVIQADGKILACSIFSAGGGGGGLGLIRLNADGSPDSSFDDNGIVLLKIGVADKLGEMLLQPDDKIVVTGLKGLDGGSISPVFVIRFLSNGSLDESFGTNGLVLLPATIALRSVSAIALQPDGKILSAGQSFLASYVVIRLLPDGRIDSTFDEDKDGVASLKFEAIDIYSAILNDIALQPDGKILAAGSGGNSNVGGYFRMAVARFNSDGSVDSAFGEKVGYSILAMPNGSATAYGVYSTADNEIILAGLYGRADVYSGFGAIKYKEDGTLDSSFGVNGVATASLNKPGGYDFGYGTAIQPDGKIVLSCVTDLGSNEDPHIGLARFNGGKLYGRPEFAKIQKWQGHSGFTWDDWPLNKTTYYLVSRSTDAVTFNEIAQVTDVQGLKKYQFEDPAPITGIAYYQLSSRRSDGKTVRSNIIMTNNTAALEKLFPNPAKNSLRIEGLPATEKTKLTITDLSGNIKTTATATGSNHALNISQLKPGNYMLHIETNGVAVTRMFVKE